MSRDNLLSLFREFERYGGDIAFVQRRGYRREEWTYRKLARMAVACALELKERGVRTGDHVSALGTEQRGVDRGLLGLLVTRGGCGAHG